MSSSQELLTLTNDAIARLLAGGQSVTLPTGVSYTQAQLPQLRELRQELMAEVNAAALGINAGGGVVRVQVPGAGSDRD